MTTDSKYMTQPTSTLILNRINAHDYMIERWASLVEEALIKEHEKSEYVMSAFHVLVANERIGDYYTNVTKGFFVDENGLHVLQQENFRYAYPLCASICTFMITAKDEAGMDQNALMVILETPLHTYLKVFKEHIVEGKKKLIYDGFMSTFTKYPKVIAQFGAINCQKAILTLN
jgi:hypothetical protein